MLLTRMLRTRRLPVLLALLGIFAASSVGRPAALLAAGPAELQSAPVSASAAWFRRLDTPYPHADLAVVATDKYLYQLGGYTRNFVTDTDGYVARYDPGTNTWDATVPDLPVPVGEIDAARIGDAIYILGGVNRQGGIDNRVQSYRELSNTWASSAGAAPRLRSRYAAVALGTSIYRIGGGQLPLSFESRDVDRYDPLHDRWNVPAKPANFPWPISFPCAEAIDGKIYVAGDGLSFSGAKAAVYDPEENSWDDAAMADPPSSARIGRGADFVLGGRLVCAGGSQANDLQGMPSRAVWTYDPVADRWQQSASMHEARFRLEGDSLGGVGYALGGWKSPGAYVGWEASAAFEALGPAYRDYLPSISVQ